jgi:hypothetical protein
MTPIRHRASRILDGQRPQRLPLAPHLESPAIAPRAVLFALAVGCLALGLGVLL